MPEPTKTLSPIDAAMASVPESNQFRARNRKENVLRLAGVVDGLLAAIGIEPEDARVVYTIGHFTEPEWTEAANRAGLACFRNDGKGPSVETRAVLVAFYAERRKQALADEAASLHQRAEENFERDPRNDDGRDGAMIEQAGA